jgi:chemotaxis protein CheX
MIELLVSPEDFELITTDICTTYVSAEAVVLPAEPGSSPGADHRAHVDLFGGVAAQVVVECDSASAADLTRRMFDLSPADPVTPDEIADALGEIANIVGGNVKSLAPSESHLSLPQVDSPASARAEHSVCRVEVIWETGRATLAVLALEPAGSVRAQ